MNRPMVITFAVGGMDSRFAVAYRARTARRSRRRATPGLISSDYVSNGFLDFYVAAIELLRSLTAPNALGRTTCSGIC